MQKPIISYMMDLSRNGVPNKDFLKKFIIYLSKMGYNELQLYMEDTYEVENEPYFGYFRGALTSEFIHEIDEFAKANGIRLVPSIEVLGHLVKLFRWDRYNYQIKDKDDVLLEGEDKTYELIENIFSSLRKSFSTDVINIGMDETYAIGRGVHLDKFGYEKQSDIFLRHLNKVCKIAEKYGFKPMMWGDMFIANDNGQYYVKNPIISDETISLKPNNVVPIYWDYYNIDEKLINGLAKAFANLDKNFIYAGGNWSWRGFAPRNDTSILVSSKIIPLVKKYGCNYFICTSWGDDGNECPELSTLPSTFAFAEFAKGNFDLDSIKVKFEKLLGISFNDFASLDNLNNIGKKLKDDILMKHNPAKYMLYSDPLGSPFDATVSVEKIKKFKKASNIYKKYIDNEDFGYIFELEYNLAKLLYVKYPIGLEIRNAYCNNNKEELKNCVQKLNKLSKLLIKFTNSVHKFWFKENAIFGLEVLDLRLGGLQKRIETAKCVLTKYLNDEIKNIELLDKPLQKYNDVDFGKEITEQTHLKCVTTGYTSFQS